MVAKKTTIFRTKGNFVLKTAKMRFYKTNTLYLYNIEMMKNTNFFRILQNKMFIKLLHFTHISEHFDFSGELFD